MNTIPVTAGSRGEGESLAAFVARLRGEQEYSHRELVNTARALLPALRMSESAEGSVLHTFVEATLMHLEAERELAQAELELKKN